MVGVWILDLNTSEENLMSRNPIQSTPTDLSGKDLSESDRPDLTQTAGLWRSRSLARVRHHLGWARRSSGILTRAHGRLIKLSGGRIGRSFLFAGGLPILVLTTNGRKSGQARSTPLAFIRHGNDFAVIASNAGNDRTPAWWLNLQANPLATVLAERVRTDVHARRATVAEDAFLWEKFARSNPGFDEYRNLTTRVIPVVILERSE
jgi:F420H(2)-dependent quinone reductase